MPNMLISGDESIAYGASLAGVRVAASYPGSPSSNCMEKLFSLSQTCHMHVEWSSNEKVAFETALGASIGGVRALMACKGVGFNVALDPIMVVNLTDVGAGLVILLGDDPGAWASQNDQDTRPIAAGTELPMLEPATPREGLEMTRAAFDLSRDVQMPVIVRITKSFGAMEELIAVPVAETFPGPEKHPFPREPMRWISVPTNAVDLHRRQHDRVADVSNRFVDMKLNYVSGSGPLGIIASGFAHTKLSEVLGDDTSSFKILKLATLSPIPEAPVSAFLRSVSSILILEENEPFVERAVKVIAHDGYTTVDVQGKEDGTVAREGELFRWQIAEALQRFHPNWVPVREFNPADETKYMPSLSGLPGNCPYTPVFQALSDLGRELAVNPVFVVDPGCAIKINTAPFEMLDVKYSMGSSIGIASGLVRAGVSDPVVAVVGDSDFFHLAVNALFNVVNQGSDLLIIILDNGTTALSGFQPVLGSGKGDEAGGARSLTIEGVVRACGVDQFDVIDPWDGDIVPKVRDALTGSGIRVVLSRGVCPCIEEGICPGFSADADGE